MSDPRIVVLGRYGTAAPARTVDLGPGVRLGYPGAGFVVSVRGRELGLELDSTSDTNALTVVVDHGEPQGIVLSRGEQVVSLLKEPGDGKDDLTHVVEVSKRSETWQGLIDLKTILLGSGTELLEAPRLSTRKLLFVGDSVTCGAGIARDDKCTNNPLKPNEDPYHSFAMVLGRRLDAQVDLVCYGGRGLQRDFRGLALRDGVLNAPDFLDLAVATDAPATRQPWNVRRWTPDAVVVELGTNDFNLQRSKPLDGDAFVRDYVKLVRSLRVEYPKALIVGTEGPIVTDPLLRSYVRAAVVETSDPRVVWAPATHYPGNACDAHPTLGQHEHIADDLEPLLRMELGW